MKYIALIDGVESPVTTDEQMYECIKSGGEFFREYDDGKRELVANGESGFLRDRPGFPVYRQDHSADQENTNELALAAKILLGMEE